MAIGDTVQAGLMRVDFSPIQRAGEAQARANQAFGQTIGNVLDKFYEKKREKAQQESIADTLVSTFGVNREEANHLSKNKEFIPTFFEQQKAQRDYQLQLDKFNLEEEKYKQALERQKKSDLQKEQDQMSENQFFQKLPSLITDPQAQRQADIARPGLAALGNGDARNRFMQAQLEDPRNQKRVLDLNDRDFLDQFKGDPRQTERALAFIEKRRAAELASQPKPLSPSDQLAREEYEDKKAEDAQEKETAKIESTNNLTDFYNETKSLLDKINEKGVDVTGPIEGTSIYRFFSKLGDTDDEQVRRRLEMFTRKLTLDAAQNLKGALSDKDIRFLVEQAPDMDDNPSVWKKYMGDLVLRLERNANQQGIELGVPQADPSAPASQSLLDEIERKKQLRSKRAGL